MGFICLYVLIQKSGQKTAKSHLCALLEIRASRLENKPSKGLFKIFITGHTFYNLAYTYSILTDDSHLCAFSF